MSVHGNVILPVEAEAFIQDLNTIDVTAIGSPKWLKRHELIYKLYAQSSLSIKYNEEEFVKDLFLSIGKIPVLIHELLVTEVWKERVFPEILKLDFNPPSTVPLYLVLYHESVVAALLGTFLFHEEVVESVNDVLIDLIDFCHRKLIPLLCSEKEKGNATNAALKRNKDFSELLEKEKLLSFSIGITVISLVSYMTRHIKVLSLGALHRFLSVHDMPMIFINLMNSKPWVRKTSAGDIEIFVSDSWIKMDNCQKLPDIEGQIWIALIQLLLDSHCIRKYEITEFRKNQLLRLRQMITETAVSQIPMLQELLRFLEQLAIFETPPAKPDLIIEQVPEIRYALMKKHDRKWKSIAEKQVSKYFSPAESDWMNLCKGLSNVYNLETLEAALPGNGICANCHKAGNKRCSRCKNEWYCGRKCQVQHWSKHKPQCNMLANEKKDSE